MGHVAVHVLNLGKVLLRHVHQLGCDLAGYSQESLVVRRRVVILVVVLLQVGEKDRTKVKSQIMAEDVGIYLQ